MEYGVSTVAEGLVVDRDTLGSGPTRYKVDVEDDDRTSRNSVQITGSEVEVGDLVEVGFFCGGSRSYWTLQEIVEKGAADIEPTEEGNPDKPCPRCGANTVKYTGSRNSAKARKWRECLNDDCDWSREYMPTG